MAIINKFLVCGYCRTQILIIDGSSELLDWNDQEVLLTESVYNTRINDSLGKIFVNGFESIHVGGIECKTCGNKIGSGFLHCKTFQPESERLKNTDYDNTDQALVDYQCALESLEEENSKRLRWWKFMNQVKCNRSLEIQEFQPSFYEATEDLEMSRGPYILELNSLIFTN